MEAPTNLNSLVEWLITGGAVIVVSWGVSWLLEGVAFWSKLSSRVKSSVILLLALVIGLLATWIKGLPPETLAQYQPYATTLIVTIGAWLATQVAHRKDEKADADIL